MEIKQTGDYQIDLEQVKILMLHAYTKGETSRNIDTKQFINELAQAIKTIYSGV